jgi:hypothetical protein
MQAAEDAQTPTHEDFVETRLLMKGDTDRREYLMANAGEDLEQSRRRPSSPMTLAEIFVRALDRIRVEVDPRGPRSRVSHPITCAPR